MPLINISARRKCLLLGVLFHFLAARAQIKHSFNGTYNGEYLQHVAFPIGGMGAGMFCLEGTGAVSHMSVRNKPEMFNEPEMFAAISINGMPGKARVLEGPVPGWKKFGQWGTGKGAEGTTYGLARFREASFLARFPFAEVQLKDKEIPLQIVLSGWSPFIPTDADNSSLPAGALEYRFKNTSGQAMELIFSYNARNFMAVQNKDSTVTANSIKTILNGFILDQEGSNRAPEQKGDFAIYTDDAGTIVDHCWFRGGWWDPLTMAWQHIVNAQAQAVAPVEKDAPGASLFVPFTLKPGEEKTIHVLTAWYVPDSKVRCGGRVKIPSDSTVQDLSALLPSRYHKPWYSSRFADIKEVAAYWLAHYHDLRSKSMLFRNAFYNSTLAPEVLEAVSANLTILKSPTVLRQYDGRLWAWEGCDDTIGSCFGSCTHVWNYAQALCHLFPALERSLRETEFNEDQNLEGHQNHRSALPIRPFSHDYLPAAADGQLGGIMKIYREWRISGDSAWLRKLYPKVKASLDYCIRAWDPRHHGVLEEPHLNTYDIEFWGPDGMCTSIYLGALEAMVGMSEYLGQDAGLYKELYDKGRSFMEKNLYNGRYFTQQIQWTGLNAPDPVAGAERYLAQNYSIEAARLLQSEGPNYQYGKGCLSDGVLGAWLARACGLPAPLDTAKISSHLLAVYKNNLKKDLSGFSNPQRPGYALGEEGGLLLCTWPDGGRLSLPFVYCNEVWTGIEYQVASHLIFQNRVKEGLDIVRTCRSRYNGLVRNPFDEYECGHWYARALSSYSLLQALTGVRYDAVDGTLYVDSRVGDFTTFLSTATGFGNITYQKGKVTVMTVYGKIQVKKTVVGQ